MEEEDIRILLLALLLSICCDICARVKDDANTLTQLYPRMLTEVTPRWRKRHRIPWEYVAFVVFQLSTGMKWFEEPVDH